MKSVLRMRHYCDFCKKSAGTKPSMEKHEKSCTNNPDRVCRMCVFGQLEQKPMLVLQAAYINGFKALSEACDGCPACILATQRQFWSSVGPEYWKTNDSRDQDTGDWDWKKASKDFLEEHRPEPAYGGY